MSNLLKQCYVVSSGTGTRIINSNDGVRQKLKELQQEQAPEQVDVSAEDGQENAPAGFSQGIQAKTVQIDVEALRREALEKAAVEADEITSTAKEDAERIRGKAEEKDRKWDIRYMRKHFPTTKFRRLSGVGHGGLAALQPKRLMRGLERVCRPDTMGCCSDF